MRNFAIILTLALVASALAGCASTSTPSPTPSSTTTPSASPSTTPAAGGAVQLLAYTATQSGSGNNTTYAFDGPNSAAPGWTLVKLTNNGMEIHQAIFMRLPMGQTFEDHMSQMMQPASNMTTNMTNQSMDAHKADTAIGGVVAASPAAPPGAPFTINNTSYTWVKLEAGTYVIHCDIPGPDGMLHSQHGMSKGLNVSATGSSNAVEPTSDLSVSVKDYAFTWSANVTNGTHVVKVTNSGTQNHEVAVIHLNAGKKLADFLAWQQAPNGPPPATDAFGGGALTPGETEYFVGNFTAGNYGVICFLPDANGAPHFTHGMMQDITVA